MSTFGTDEKDVELGHYRLLPQSDDKDKEKREEEEKKKKEKGKVQWWIVLPLLFLSLSQALQWAVVITAGTMLVQPYKQVTTILLRVDTPQFYNAITSAENIAKQVDEPKFYSALTSAENIASRIDRQEFYDAVARAENIAKQVDRQEFYDTLASLETKVVPALPKLIANINTPAFYTSLSQLQSMVIPDVVKLMPTFDRLPKFLNETERLMKDFDTLLRRFHINLTTADADAEETGRSDASKENNGNGVWRQIVVKVEPCVQ